MRIILVTGFAALAVAATMPPTARAEEEHRELGPHVHGHGTLNIAVEGKRISMELEAPGMDIVGFEHSAKSGEQQDAIAKAKGALADPLALFKLPASAGCSVQEAKVAIESEHGREHQHGGAQDEPAKAEEDDRDHDDHAEEHHAADDHDEEESHNAFHVTYALDCADPTALTSIGFDYFKSFPGAGSLTVNVVTAKAQSSYEVSRDKPELNLAGVM